MTMKYCLVFILTLDLFCVYIHSQSIPWPPKVGYQEQILDHFNFLSVQRGYTTKFKQRFLYEDKWYKPGGPLFFYCGNEGSIEGFWNNTGLMFELAPKFNALVVFGEHRYYGVSLPFGVSKSFRQPYIQYLSVEQALADFVYMIPHVQGKLKAANSKVIAFGGSYGGCLAAYIRFKYPNVVLGSLAASAPIGWVSGGDGFHKFFEVITKDFREENAQCVDIVKDGFGQMRYLATQGQPGFQLISKYLKTCKPLTSISDVNYAMKWLRNGFVMLAMMDYPYATNFMGNLPAHPVRVACQNILANKDNSIVALREAGAVYYNTSQTSTCFSPFDLYIECSDITGCGLGPDSLAWDFQACTEMKLYDDSNATSGDMFPDLPLTRQQVDKHCIKKFEVDRADNQLKYLEWGDYVRTATNIIFSNGDLDPWSLGGITENASLPSSSVALWIKGGAHHLDLRSSNPADPPSVQQARQSEEFYIRKWLNEN